jgi:ferredoxin-like protein FixX
MELEIVMLNGISQKKTTIACSLSCAESREKKNDINVKHGDCLGVGTSRIGEGKGRW